MAALTSGSWTISYVKNKQLSTSIAYKERTTNLKLALVSGTVPSAGIPLPTFRSAGMVRYLDHWVLLNPETTAFGTASGTATFWGINTTGNTIKAYQAVLASGTGRSIISLATTINVPAQNFYVEAHGW